MTNDLLISDCRQASNINPLLLYLASPLKYARTLSGPAWIDLPFLIVSVPCHSSEEANTVYIYYLHGLLARDAPACGESDAMECRVT